MMYRYFLTVAHTYTGDACTYIQHTNDTYRYKDTVIVPVKIDTYNTYMQHTYR
jgi:hypothetical protein